MRATIAFVALISTAWADELPVRLEATSEQAFSNGSLELLGPPGGRISVDDAPWAFLPQRFKADGKWKMVVVQLPGCTDKRSVRFSAQKVTFSCSAPQGPRVVITADIEVAFEVHAKGMVPAVGVLNRGRQRSDHPPIFLPPAAQEVVVRCSAPEHLPWQRIRLTSGAQRLDEHCEPKPARRLLILSSNAANTQFYAAGARLTGLRKAPTPLVFGSEGGIVKRVEAGVEYYTTDLPPGKVRLCARALGHHDVCRPVELGAEAQPTRVHFVLELDEAPAPVPVPTGAVQPVPPVRAEEGWSSWSSLALGVGSALALGGAIYAVDARAGAIESRHDLRQNVVTEVQDHRNQDQARFAEYAGGGIALAGLAAVATALVWEVLK